MLGASLLPRISPVCSLLLLAKRVSCFSEHRAQSQVSGPSSIARLARTVTGSKSTSPRYHTQRFAYLSSSTARNMVSDNNNNNLYVSVDDAIANQDDFVFVDGSWWLPNMQRNARQEFNQGPRIPQARFFDIDDVCLEASLNPKQLPHMMPQPELFGQAMDALNIQQEDKLVVYGQEGCPFLHRTWYTFHSMGHTNVQLLKGSLSDWKAKGGSVDTSDTETMRVESLDKTKEPKYQASDPCARAVASMEQVQNALTDDTIQIIDVRSADRFYGRVDEPRPGLRLGHMPGAANIFFGDLLESTQSSILKDNEALKLQLKDVISMSPQYEEIIATCGSGATACTLAAALHQLGHTSSNVRIYDGSWCEWGGDPDVPIVKD